MKKTVLLLFILAIVACNSHNPLQDIDTTPSPEDKQGGDGKNIIVTSNYFFGIWQNINHSTDFLMFSYDLNSRNRSEGFGGTCPLKPDPNNKNLVDTTAYYSKPAYSFSFKISPHKIDFFYSNLNKQEVRMKGEIKLMPNNTIKTPIGTFKKLTQDEIKAISPQS